MKQNVWSVSMFSLIDAAATRKNTCIDTKDTFLSLIHSNIIIRFTSTLGYDCITGLFIVTMGKMVIVSFCVLRKHHKRVVG